MNEQLIAHRLRLIDHVRKVSEENLQGYIATLDEGHDWGEFTKEKFAAYVLTCASEIAEEKWVDDKDNPVWPEDMEDCGGIEFAVSCIAYREAARRYLYRSHAHHKVDRFIAHLEGYIPGIEGFRWWKPEEADKVYAMWVNGTLGI